MRACGYVRTSPVAGGAPSDYQMQLMEEFADQQGLSIHRWYVDEGVSGNEDLADRPEGAAMLSDVSGGVYDTVVVMSSARLGCDPKVYQRALDDIVGAGGHVRILCES